MSTSSLQLLESPGNYKKDGDELLYNPKAQVALKTYSKVKQTVNKNKEIEFTVISPECYSLSEINYVIDRLIKELEVIRTNAKRFFINEENKKKKAFQK